jgi:hypothetical protein
VTCVTNPLCDMAHVFFRLYHLQALAYVFVPKKVGEYYAEVGRLLFVICYMSSM